MRYILELRFPLILLVILTEYKLRSALQLRAVALLLSLFSDSVSESYISLCSGEPHHRFSGYSYIVLFPSRVFCAWICPQLTRGLPIMRLVNHRKRFLAVLTHEWYISICAVILAYWQDNKIKHATYLTGWLFRGT